MRYKVGVYPVDDAGINVSNLKERGDLWVPGTTINPNNVGVSRAQGYRLIKLDIDESGVDRQELLNWSIQMLMAAAGQAMKQKNPGAVVACIRQLDHMTGTGYNSHRGNGNR